jgi:hypothetical protein
VLGVFGVCWDTQLFFFAKFENVLASSKSRVVYPNK